MKVDATVHVTIELPPGYEMVDRMHSDGEDLGPHIKVGGKPFCPFINWMVCYSHYLQTPTELGLGDGPVWLTCEMHDTRRFCSRFDFFAPQGRFADLTREGRLLKKDGGEGKDAWWISLLRTRSGKIESQPTKRRRK